MNSFGYFVQEWPTACPAEALGPPGCMEAVSGWLVESLAGPGAAAALLALQVLTICLSCCLGRANQYGTQVRQGRLGVDYY